MSNFFNKTIHFYFTKTCYVWITNRSNRSITFRIIEGTYIIKVQIIEDLLKNVTEIR